MEKILLISQIAATLALTGAIWIVQLIQYPFFAYIEESDFPKYHAAYTFWVTPIVAPLMIVELATSFLILFFPPRAIEYNLLFFGFILSVSVWLSTFFVQIPLHNALAKNFDINAHKSLVRTNWIRTAAWTARGVLVLFFAWELITV